MRRFSCTPPLRYVLLTSRDPGIRARTTAWAAQLRTALYKLEEEIGTDDFLKAYHRDMMWATASFPREVLVALAETYDTTCPEDMILELENMSRGFHTSVIVENGNKHLSSCAKYSPNGQIAGPTRWHRLLTSSLSEEWDRRLPQTLPIDNACKAPRFNKSCFDPLKSRKDFSLGETMLDNIGSKDCLDPAFLFRCKLKIQRRLKLLGN